MFLALTNILQASGMNKDVALCPVRAFRVYLQRAKHLHSGKSLMFSHIFQAFLDIDKATNISVD